MPAAAVIPAPIVYIKFVAVKTLVVGGLLGAKDLAGKGSWNSPTEQWGKVSGLRCVLRSPVFLL